MQTSDIHQQAKASQRGSAVVIVLFFLLMMITIALTMAYVTRIGKQVAINNNDSTRAYYWATSGVERALAYLDDVAPLVNSVAEDGEVDFNESSFSPPHFIDPLTNTWFFDDNGIFAYYSNGEDKVNEVEFKIINHTGKLDPNWNRRPETSGEGETTWNRPTFGTTPFDIDVRYLTGDSIADLIYQTSIDGRWLGIEEIRRLIYDRDERTEKNLATLPMIPYSPYGEGESFRSSSSSLDATEEELAQLTAKELATYQALKEDYLKHANTFLDRDGTIYERLNLTQLRSRVLDLPLGLPVMKSELYAQAVFDYLAFYHPKHVARIEELRLLIASAQSDLENLIKANFPDTWQQISALRTEQRKINNQLHNIGLQTELNNAYLDSSSSSSSHQDSLNSSNTNLASKKQELKDRLQQIKNEISALVNFSEDEATNSQSQLAYDMILTLENKIHAYQHEKRQHEYIRDAYLFWVETGLPTLENFHKEAISILTDDGKTPIPALTRILEYYYANDPYAYFEFLANLRDFFDGDSDANLKWDANFSQQLTAGFDSTTVHTRYLLPRDPFFRDKTYETVTFPAKYGIEPRDLHQYYYAYCGAEIGPVISDIRFSFVPRWKYTQERQPNGSEGEKVKYYQLYIDVYASFGLMNPESEYDYYRVGISMNNMQITAVGSPSQKDKYYTTATSQTQSKNYSRSSLEFDSGNNNKWLIVSPSDPIATFTLGEVKEGTTFDKLTLTLNQIQDLSLRLRWAGVDGNFLVDKVKLNLDISQTISLKQLGLSAAGDNGESETATKAAIIDLSAVDPLCNTVASNGTINYWSTSTTIADSLDEVELDNTSLRYSTLFVRNGIPWSLWELINIHRGSPNQFLNLYGGTKKPDGSYAKGDWELFDQLSLTLSESSGGELNSEYETLTVCEHGKINPNIQRSLVWDTILMSQRLGKWKTQTANFPEIYPPQEYYPEFYQDFRAITGETSEEVGEQSLATSGVSQQLPLRNTTQPLMSRGQLALYYSDLFANINTSSRDTAQKRCEILGKIMPLLQTRYQYFEIIAIGRDCKELDEVDQTDEIDKAIQATCRIRVFVERDAYTGSMRPLTYEVLEE